MTNLAMGANAPISSIECVLDIHLPQDKAIDVSALQLYAGSKVRSDGDMCFFNQPSIAAGAVALIVKENVQSFSLNLGIIDNDVEKIVLNATLESGQFSAIDDVRITTSFGVSMLVETSGRTESALILCELYKRNSQWKIRNISQGFLGGLQALAEHFGVNVDEPEGSADHPVSESKLTPVSTPTSSDNTSTSEPSPTANAPGMLDRLKQTAEQARSRLTTEASKFKNRTFMEAVVNGCVLVAAADGSIDATEKQKMAGYLQHSNELKHFGIGEVIDVFQKAATAYENDNVLGKACALEIIRKIKSNEEQARLLIRVVCAIGAADGDFDTQEREMVSHIAGELGLDPADFDI